MNNIIRNKCVLTNDDDMETLVFIKKVPIFMGATNENKNSDITSNMIWQINKKSGMIQLKKIINKNILYNSSHNSGVIGETWKKHHFEFAKFINKYNPHSILEIGGGSGRLCDVYIELYKYINWTIIDINPVPGANCKAKYIKSDFDLQFENHEQFDVLVHSHFFEHVYEPITAMRKMSNMVSENKKMIFSIPNMEVMLKSKFSNCLNFEHTFLLNETYIEFLLSKFGFNIVKKHYFLNNHSIFYCVQKITIKKQKTITFEGLYEHNKALFNDYIKYNEFIVSYINNLNFSSLYLFGAHIFSQNLISLGVNTNKIKCILDNDTNKHFKRLYGTSLKIEPVEIIQYDSAPHIVLCAGAYNEEIKDQLYKINSKSVFYIF